MIYIYRELDNNPMDKSGIYFYSLKDKSSIGFKLLFVGKFMFVCRFSKHRKRFFLTKFTYNKDGKLIVKELLHPVDYVTK